MEDEPKHSDVAAIFTQLLAELKLSPTQFAKSLEPATTQQAIQTYTSGKSKPGSKVLASIIKKYPAINAVWLMTGEGVPFPNGRFSEKKPEPFLPGGELNSFGATVMPRGGQRAALGANFGEDVDQPAGQQTPTPVPTNAKEFVAGVLKEYDDIKASLRASEQEREKLHRIITEQQGTVRFLQKQVESLSDQLASVGKTEGNHYHDAPGDYSLVAEPTPPIGFKVRMMYPNGLPAIVQGESMRVAA